MDIFDLTFHCSCCGIECNPVYLCDRDKEEYCEACFPGTGCEENHSEGCMTIVWQTDDLPETEIPDDNREG